MIDAYKGGFGISTLEVNYAGKTLMHAWRLKLISQLFNTNSVGAHPFKKQISTCVIVLSKRQLRSWTVVNLLCVSV